MRVQRLLQCILNYSLNENITIVQMDVLAQENLNVPPPIALTSILCVMVKFIVLMVLMNLHYAQVGFLTVLFCYHFHTFDTPNKIKLCIFCFIAHKSPTTKPLIPECKPTEFSCKNRQRCVPLSAHCDSWLDCQDGSDEYMCCTFTFF